MEIFIFPERVLDVNVLKYYNKGFVFDANRERFS